MNLRLVYITTCSLLLLGACTMQPGKRSMGTMLDDQALELSIKSNMKKIDERLKKAHITVVSFNHIVLLVGQVPTADLKILAFKVAQKTIGVRRIVNELIISGNTALLLRTSDALITTQVKAALTSKGLKHVKVITEVGTVYLMGLVTPAQGKQAVAIARRTRGVQHITKVFEYLPPPSQEK